MHFLKDKTVVDKAEDLADKVLRNGKHILPHVARLFLISTFLEDSLRMWFQWDEQTNYMETLWSCGTFMANIFVIINMFGQLSGCVMILARLRVPIACVLLTSMIVLQTIAYGLLTDMIGLLRNISLVGGILLLYAESQVETRSLFAGLPSAEASNANKQYFQLGGRILLLFMLITGLRLEMSFFHMIQVVCCLALMSLIALGYKTKLGALILVAWLLGMNLVYNNWWTLAVNTTIRDLIKYDFFQLLSVMGGLLLVVALGPGGVSLDEHKKRW